MSRLQAERVLGAILREGVDLGVLSETGAELLAQLANPDALWGNKPPNLRAAVRQALRPRVFEREGRTAELAAGRDGTGEFKP